MELVKFSALNSSFDGSRSASLMDALTGIMTVAELNGRWVIDTPLVTLGGSAVRVAVWPQDGGSTFIVSDDGAAHYEAEAAGCSSKTFLSAAAPKAAAYGVRLDSCALMLMKVRAEQLRGAVITMANLIKEVLDETAERTSKEKAMRMGDELRDRLADAFGPRNVYKNADISGGSNVTYQVDAIVSSGSGLLAFDTFTKSGNSVNSIFTKFSDIRQRDDAPRAVAVTKNREAIGPKLTLVASVATVIDVDSPRDRLLGLAAA